MKTIDYCGTVHWQHHSNTLPMICGIGDGKFGTLITFLGDFVSDRAMSEMDAALEKLETDAEEVALGYNYSIVYFDRVHELSRLRNVAELVFNYSREMFFIMDIAEFVSVTRQLNAVYRSQEPVPISVTLYDAPETCRRPGSLFDLEEGDPEDALLHGED